MPIEIAKYIFSYLDRDVILSLHNISTDFASFSKFHLRDILFEKLQRTTKFNIINYNLSRLIKLSAFNFSNSDVSAGDCHSLFLTNKGEVYGCGYNVDGQLGLDYHDNIYRPTIIPSLSNAKYITSSVYRSAVITHDVYIFGLINHIILKPTMLSTNNSVMKIAFGEKHALVLKDDRKVYVFGDNTGGQLGLGDYNSQDDINTLRTIDNFANIIDVAAGNNHSLILTDTGQVYSFGLNIGQLGLGDFYNKNQPTLIKNLTNVVKIAANRCLSLVLTEDGQIYISDSFGYMTVIKNFHNIIDISARNVYILILTSDNQILAFKNSVEPFSTYKFNEPINHISCGGGHALISTKNGKFYSLGGNHFGQLGLGDINDREVPELIKMNL